MASKTLILKNVILSFPQNLWVPGVPINAQATSKPKYGCQFIIDPDSPEKAMIDGAIQEIAQAAWPKDFKRILASIDGNTNKMCFIDGNRRVKWAGYENKWGLSAGRQEQHGPPLLLDGRKQPVKESDGLLYGGAIVNAKVDLFTYDKPSPGISCGLQVVMFAKHGTSFGGAGRASADDMDEIPFEDDDDAFDIV